MHLNKVLTILLFCNSFSSALSQHKDTLATKYVSKKWSKEIRNIIDFDNLFVKKTGEKIDKVTFFKMKKKLGDAVIEEKLNYNGEVIKYLAVFGTSSKFSIADTNNKPKVGELYPNIGFTTIDNKKNKLRDLKGKIVILRFELDTEKFRIMKDELSLLNTAINKFGKNNFKTFVIFSFSSSKEILKSYFATKENFEFVEKAVRLATKLKINRTPTTLVIDKSGKLVNYYKRIEDIDLKKILESSSK